MRDQWLRTGVGESAVVFVHGVLSSDAAWRHENGTFWPALLASDPAMADVGIYVFSYASTIFSGTYRIGDVVDALRDCLRLDGVLERRQLVFVCHSMGGIVVRKFVVERAADLIERGTHLGLFLVASPSLGSSYANWLSPIARVLRHAQADALRFTQDNAWLNDLDKEFLNLKESRRIPIRGKELIEDRFVTLSSLWRKQVVEPFSGARYFGEALKVPGSDHFSIAKPANGGAVQHRLLVEFVATHGAADAPPPASTVTRVASQSHVDTLAHLASKIEQQVRWDDVVLPAATMQQIGALTDAAVEHAVQRRADAAEPARVQTLDGQALAVLHGPSGTGKSLAARALASHLGVELYVVDYTNLIAPQPSDTAQRLRQLSGALSERGAWLLMRDAELLFPAQGVHTALFAAELPYAAILTTTSLALLDPRLVDEAAYVVAFALPDAEGRFHIWRRAIPRDAPVSNDVHVEALAARFSLSGADIARAVEQALQAARREANWVTMRHLEAAAERLATRRA